MKDIICIKSIIIADNPSYIQKKLVKGEKYTVSDYLAAAACERGYAELVVDTIVETKEKMSDEPIKNKMIDTSEMQNKSPAKKTRRSRKTTTDNK